DTFSKRISCIKPPIHLAIGHQPARLIAHHSIQPGEEVAIGAMNYQSAPAIRQQEPNDESDNLLYLHNIVEKTSE
ncbi:hypothetical protein V6330_03855, partial [Citrobacter portucalensis]|uniref:hypothetical protein n=1 Tax=Citrobacter portucalensis TaxID=1639133 RepID=UPI002FE578A3